MFCTLVVVPKCDSSFHTLLLWLETLSYLRIKTLIYFGEPVEMLARSYRDPELRAVGHTDYFLKHCMLTDHILVKQALSRPNDINGEKVLLSLKNG